MSHRDEIRPTTYEEWNALEEERDQLRAELARLRSAPAAAQMTDAELDAIYPESPDLGTSHHDIHRSRLRSVIAEAVRRLRSAPVAVEVPDIVWRLCRETSPAARHAMASEWMGRYLSGRTSPRLLKEGERAVPVELLQSALEALRCSEPYIGCGYDHSAKYAAAIDRIEDAIRSSKEGT